MFHMFVGEKHFVCHVNVPERKKKIAKSALIFQGQFYFVLTWSQNRDDRFFRNNYFGLINLIGLISVTPTMPLTKWLYFLNSVAN